MSVLECSWWGSVDDWVPDFLSYVRRKLNGACSGLLRVNYFDTRLPYAMALCTQAIPCKVPCGTDWCLYTWIDACRLCAYGFCVRG